MANCKSKFATRLIFDKIIYIYNVLAKKPKYLRILLISLGVMVVLFTGLHWFVKQKAMSLIETALPKNIALNYADLNISTLGRSVSISNVSIILIDSVSQNEMGNITIEKLQLKHFGIFDYLFNKTLHLDYIGVANTQGYLKLPDHTEKDSIKPLKKFPVTTATINTIAVTNLSFELRDPKTDNATASMLNVNLTVEDVKGHQDMEELNVSYGDYTISTDSISLVLGPLYHLQLQSIEGTNNSTAITSARLATIYTPKELSRHIVHEKDYFDITIPKITATNIPNTFSKNSVSVNIGSVTIEQPKALIYRDKLVADDLSIKPMLSAQLRNIPIPFHIKQFIINEAQLTYQERVHDYNDGGALTIDNSTITIENLSNIETYQPLTIAVSAKFTSSGHVKANWEFDVLNDNDDFKFSADVSNLNLASLNGFCHPNFNAEMEGHINQLYYTITGNKHSSHIDIKSNHSEIKVTVLTKDHNHKNKFFSSVANLMISKNSKHHKSGFIEVNAQVERDMTKSGFNFIFKNVKTGMTKIFI